MGHFSVKLSGHPGSLLSANQHRMGAAHSDQAPKVGCCTERRSRVMLDAHPTATRFDNVVSISRMSRAATSNSVTR